MTIIRWMLLLCCIVVAATILLRFGAARWAHSQGGRSYTLRLDYSDIDQSITELEQRIAAEKNDKKKSLLQEDLSNVQATRNGALEQTEKVLRGRTQHLGAKFPTVEFEETDGVPRFLVYLPGTTPDQDLDIQDILSTEGRLTFQAVDRNNRKRVDKMFDAKDFPAGFEAADMNDPYLNNLLVWTNSPSGSPEEILQAFRIASTRDALARHRAHAGNTLMLDHEIIDGKTYYEPLFVNKRIELREESVGSAGIRHLPLSNNWAIFIQFNGDEFGRVTEELAPNGERNTEPWFEEGQPGRRLAILLDGALLVAPRIQSTITHSAEITGSFEAKDARRIDTLLRYGPLPVPLVVDSSAQVPAK